VALSLSLSDEGVLEYMHVSQLLGDGSGFDGEVTVGRYSSFTSSGPVPLLIAVPLYVSSGCPLAALQARFPRGVAGDSSAIVGILPNSARNRSIMGGDREAGLAYLLLEQ
jgi:hypothetical protein